MSKIKIEIELDIDFQKFFDNIPEGLYKDKEGTSKEYELEAVGGVLNSCYMNALLKDMDWMKKPEYLYAKHHLLIDTEIAKQLSKNYKIVNYQCTTKKK